MSRFDASALALVILAAVALLFSSSSCMCCSAHETDLSTIVPSEPLPPCIQVKVMTMNVQCLPISSASLERMGRIGEWILEHDVDVIGFQEAMSAKARARVMEVLNDGAVSGERRYEGTYFDCKFGSGLFIVSKWPIQATFFHPYRKQGPVFDSGFDWWAGKGIAMAVIEVSQGVYLNFIDTHVISFYPRGVDKLLTMRFAQMRQLAEFVDKVVATGGSTIVVGDLNCGERDEEWQYLSSKAGLVPLLHQCGIHPDIDHIFGVERNPALQWDCKEAFQLGQRNRASDGSRWVVSDHDGYVARICLQRVPARSED